MTQSRSVARNQVFGLWHNQTQAKQWDHGLDPLGLPRGTESKNKPTGSPGIISSRRGDSPRSLAPGPWLHFSLPSRWVRVPPAEVGANGCTLKGELPHQAGSKEVACAPGGPTPRHPVPAMRCGGWPLGMLAGRWLPRPQTALSLARRGPRGEHGGARVGMESACCG